MLHQCGHQSASAYPCSCGFLCGGGGCGGGGGGGAAATFSFLFPVPGKPSMDEVFDGAGNANAFSSSSSSSLVDCTLSLGTPSTRQTEEKVRSSQSQRPSCMSSFCWDILSGSKKGISTNGSNGGNSSTGTGSSLGDDPLLLARRCANCDTTSTPLWRNGPRGPKSLCNACGIRYKKEERRAAASTISMSPSSAAVEQGIGYGYHRTQPSPWGCYTTSSVRSSTSISMYEDMADDGGDAPFLSWRLNVVPPTQFPVRDRPSLFQYN